MQVWLTKSLATDSDAGKTFRPFCKIVCRGKPNKIHIPVAYFVLHIGRKAVRGDNSVNTVA